MYKLKLFERLPRSAIVDADDERSTDRANVVSCLLVVIALAKCLMLIRCCSRPRVKAACPPSSSRPQINRKRWSSFRYTPRVNENKLRKREKREDEVLCPPFPQLAISLQTRSVCFCCCCGYVPCLAQTHTSSKNAKRRIVTILILFHDEKAIQHAFQSHSAIVMRNATSINTNLHQTPFLKQHRRLQADVRCP